MKKDGFISSFVETRAPNVQNLQVKNDKSVTISSSNPLVGESGLRNERSEKRKYKKFERLEVLKAEQEGLNNSFTNNNDTTSENQKRARSNFDYFGEGFLSEPDGFYRGDRLGQKGLFSGSRANNVILLPSAQIGEDYCAFLVPDNEQTPDNTYLVSGNTPEGLSIHTHPGRICGVAMEGGVFEFSVKFVVDSYYELLNQYKLIVSEEDGALIGPLEIKTLELPRGFIGQSYYFKLQGSAPKLPVLWTVNSLPLGLSLDSKKGILHGTPQEAGVFELSLSLFDADNESVFTTLSLEIVSSPLFLTTKSLPQALVGQEYGVYFASKGGEPPYRWRIVGGSLPEGLSLDYSSGLLSGVPAAKMETTLRISVLDEAQNVDSADFAFAVIGVSLAISTDELPVGIKGQQYFFLLSAVGGDPPYSWNIVKGGLPSGLSLNTNGSISSESGLIFDGDSLRTSVVVMVSDSSGLVSRKEFIFNGVQSELKISTDDIYVGSPCEEFRTKLMPIGGQSPYKWSIESGSLPSSFQLFSDGTILREIQQSDFEEINSTFVVRVEDALGSVATKLVHLALKVSELQIDKSIETIPARVGEVVDYAFVATGGCAPYSWEMEMGIDSLFLSSLGVLEGVPKEQGTFEIVIRAKDSLENVAKSSFKLVASSSDLKILTTELPDAVANEPYDAHLNATGGVAPYHWGLVSGGLPEGVTINSEAHVIEGVPKDSGSYSFTMIARDESGTEVSFSYLLDVRPGEMEVVVKDEVQEPPCEGEHFNIKFAASGGVPPYSWSLLNADLTDSLSISSGQLSGVLTHFGTYVINIKASDARNVSIVYPYTLNVLPADLQIVSDTLLPDLKVGQEYYYALSAVGGEEPYSWKLVAGDLPTGVFFDGVQGFFEGQAEEAIYNQEVTVQVVDSVGRVTEKRFIINVSLDGLPGVTNLIVQGSKNCAGIAWENPDSSYFKRAIIVRSAKYFPSSVEDGKMVYSSTLNNFVDEQLDSNTTYYYAAFADYGTKGVVPPGASGMRDVAILEVSLNPKYSDPFVDKVIDFDPLDSNCFGCQLMPSVVLGPPKGEGESFGSTDVVSINSRVNSDMGKSSPYGGSITLEFVDNIVKNGPGLDFTIFENAFRISNSTHYFLEPAVVEVSIDGNTYYRFPIDFVPHYDENGIIDLQNPYSYSQGFAGINPVYSNGLVPDPTNPLVSGGDSFDLDDLEGVKLSWIRFVRIIATGDKWLKDKDSQYVRHGNESPSWSCSGVGSSGFDLDAIAAVNY